jgi:hypothetical protein
LTKSSPLASKEDVKQMIEAAMRQHNRNATLISFAIGSLLLFFYANGVLRIVEKMSPT